MAMALAQGYAMACHQLAVVAIIRLYEAYL